MTKEGGPAFPQTHAAYCEGMTLRDWFAGMAASGMMACGFTEIEAVNHRMGGNWYDNVAEHAYDVADAMLSAREEAGE